MQSVIFIFPTVAIEKRLRKLARNDERDMIQIAFPSAARSGRILAEGAIALSVTLSGGALFAS